MCVYCKVLSKRPQVLRLTDQNSDTIGGDHYTEDPAVCCYVDGTTERFQVVDINNLLYLIHRGAKRGGWNINTCMCTTCVLCTTSMHVWSAIICRKARLCSHAASTRGDY